MTSDFSFEIKQKIGVLSTKQSGWSLELNKVSWNGKEEKYDIRSWDAEHKKMGKGVTLTGEELEKLKEVLLGMKKEGGGE